MYSLGCDIGGTFTDFVLLNQVTGEVTIHKRLTTPQDPSEGIRIGVQELMEAVPDCLSNAQDVIHGTTLVINAVIERKGAKTGLITTKGFRDVLEIRRGLRYELYDLHIDFPPPLIPRYFRREIWERIYSNGEVLRKPKKKEISHLLKEFIDDGVESIAVCFLHSYKNPVHERLVKKIASNLCPHISISLSSEVLPEIKEYERMSTTTLNAYVKPLFSFYLRNLGKKLKSLGFRRQLFLLLSSGGIVPAKAVEDFPVRVIESGPAGGVMLTQHLLEIAKEKDDLFSFDMGGTTAKSCLIKDGKLPKSNDYEVARMERFKQGSGIPVKTPTIHLLEIGAGGGSIASVNHLGLLQVGPQSSGASPGPACYGRGGKNPCVTDADLVLGYLNRDYFLGGEMKLDKDVAKRAIEEKIARPLRINVTDAAWGIHNIVNENMALAAKMHIIERGGNPLKTILVAFGGAGPIHAYGLAKKLRMPKILIPPRAGVASALGFFVAPYNYELVHTYKVLLEETDFSKIEQAFRKLEKEAIHFLPKMEKPNLINYLRSVDVQYVGQGYEINIPLTYKTFSKLQREDISKNFNSTYEKIYGRTYPDKKIEMMHLRVIATASGPPLSFQKLYNNKKESPQSSVKGRRKAYSFLTGSFVDFTVYDRYCLVPGTTLRGPAIVEERESTIILDKDATASMDGYGNIVILLE